MDKSRIKGKGVSVVMRAEGRGRKVRSRAHQIYILPVGFFFGGGACSASTRFYHVLASPNGAPR